MGRSRLPMTSLCMIERPLKDGRDLRRMIGDELIAGQFAFRGPKPETVAHQADAGAGGPRRPQIDRRVADHDGVDRASPRREYELMG